MFHGWTCLFQMNWKYPSLITFALLLSMHEIYGRRKSFVRYHPWRIRRLIKFGWLKSWWAGTSKEIIHHVITMWTYKYSSTSCFFYLIVSFFTYALSAENNLSGEIPTKLGDLRNLEVLDLRECVKCDHIFHGVMQTLYLYKVL